MRQKKLKQSFHVPAFSLIELLIVIAIIGLMAMIAVVAVNANLLKARDMKRKADLKQMRTALEFYLDKYGAYPSTGSGWWGTCSTYGTHANTGSNGYIPNLSPEFTGLLPKDPTGKANAYCTGLGIGPEQSCFLYKSDGTHYKLLAHCTIESLLPTSDPFYDPMRPNHAYMVCDGDITTCNTW
jgi:prepilin-type N-terminal cleavage/methylation domain-containing protein